ncbi:MAG: hypothetical protein IK092_01580 [Muribaculaceae bacterium]|nr:hypothetical protein [Muribaculaceae bacterium]
MDDNFDDYFEGEAPEEPKQEHVETPEERLEREIKETTIERRTQRRRMFWTCLGCVVAIYLVAWTCNRYFRPYAEGEESGRIVKITSQGSIFKTYEGQMVSEKFISDTVHAYTADFFFTVPNDSIARRLNQLAGSGHKVKLKYKEYKGKLPWRGATTHIVTEITEY